MFHHVGSAWMPISELREQMLEKAECHAAANRSGARKDRELSLRPIENMDTNEREEDIANTIF